MRVHHVAFRTLQLERLAAFYAETLGLAVLRRDVRSVWLDAGGAIVMLEQQAPGEPLVPAGTMEMVAFAIAPDDPIVRRVAVEARTAYTVYVRDPDGRRIGLSSYPEPLVTSS